MRTLVEMLAPYKGRVYDPCCGSGGMFVQAAKFIQAHASGNGNGGKAKGDIAIYGQESNSTIRRLAMMNLAIRGIDGDLGKEHADTFRRDLHKDLKADFVLANGSMSSNQSGEGDIRKAIVEADLVDCMVALPGQLFYSTQIPVCLWFLARNKGGDKRRDRKQRGEDGKSDSSATSASSAFQFRDRRGETLFIDARKLGVMIDRVHRELTDDEIKRLADTYHNWQSGKRYKDIPGFCRSATKAEIAEHGYEIQSNH